MVRCGNPLCQPPDFIHLQRHNPFSASVLYKMPPRFAKPSLEQQKVGFRPLISSAICRSPNQLAGAGLPVRTRRLAEQRNKLVRPYKIRR
jgi:hypothetical protein